MTTNNHDVRVLHNEYCRYIEEVIRCQSANLSMIRAADKNRMLSYLRRMTEIINWIVAQPQVDLPESHPDAYELRESPAIVKIENEILNTLITLLDLGRKENARSSSSGAPSGLVSFDEERQRQYLAKMTALLTLSDSVSPADFPESSPRAAGVKDGRDGTHAGVKKA